MNTYMFNFDEDEITEKAELVGVDPTTLKDWWNSLKRDDNLENLHQDIITHYKQDEMLEREEAETRANEIIEQVKRGELLIHFDTRDRMYLRPLIP